MNLRELEKWGVPVFGDTSFRDRDCLKEAAEQVSYFSLISINYPEVFDVACHIRNEGKRERGARRDIQEGMNVGASDISIPGNPSCLIELKRLDHTLCSVSKKQLKYLVRARKMGSFACVALGCTGAIQATKYWLESINNAP